MALWGKIEIELRDGSTHTVERFPVHTLAARRKHKDDVFESAFHVAYLAAKDAGITTSSETEFFNTELKDFRDLGDEVEENPTKSGTTATR